jgi:hypothetical protein
LCAACCRPVASANGPQGRHPAHSQR